MTNISRRALLIGSSAAVVTSIIPTFAQQPVMPPVRMVKANVPKPFGSSPVRRAQVQANGASFHVIEQGEGPAIMFCHGFPDTADRKSVV